MRTLILKYQKETSFECGDRGSGLLPIFLSTKRFPTGHPLNRSVNTHVNDQRD